MKPNYDSPVAIVEIELNGVLFAINQAAIDLFSLPKTLLQDKQTKPSSINIYQLLNIKENDHLNHATIVLNQQYYFLQIVEQQTRKIFIIQPLDYLKNQLSKKGVVQEHAFDIFCANSKVMQKLITQAEAFSRQKQPLLISGATGTGKDLLALACHHYSERGDQVFLGLNCAAMPDEVVESELYGHAPGAYPGAVEGKKGFFEQANGGSVLLDGIDEMSFSMQTKLLRFINDGSFRRVGDDNEVKVDVRVICATKADLFSRVKQGTFREDLYYRLNVLPLHLPLLKERKEDFTDLIQHVIHEFANKQNIPIPNITSEAVLKLSHYDWPGNVRELKNILYLSLAQLKEGKLDADDIHLPNVDFVSIQSLLEPDLNDKTLDEMIKQYEKAILAQLYHAHPSSRKLSKRLGISHTAVANKLRDYGIGKTSLLNVD